MAIPKACVVLIFSLLMFHLTNAYQGVNQGKTNPTPLPPTTTTTMDCAAACKIRCSKTKRPNLCKRACGSCCSKCKCVPPGTYGNYETCPCYFNLTTRNKIRKCP
ncbi:hypothetical protein ACH5RR_013645 [Cinchona calisaya]|uniref:Uncharacterized protein n=1 Tax=Cinchona calisaya TaxID=153742 RepID=A0ABD3A6E8_9GENT